MKPETIQKGVTVEEDVMSSAFEKPVWKNTVISKTARADVKYVKEQYGIDIDILQGNKVKIGDEVFDCGNLDKGEVAKIVKNVNDKSSFIETDLKSKTYKDELKFFETYSDAYNKQAVRKSIVEHLPSELQAEGREWLLANENGVGKTKSNGNKISREYVNSYAWDNTNLKFSRDGKYATNTEMTLKLDLLAKHGYEVTVDGLDYGNRTHLTGVKVTRDGVTKTIDYDSNFSTQESFNKWLNDALQDIVNESEYTSKLKASTHEYDIDPYHGYRTIDVPNFSKETMTVLNKYHKENPEFAEKLEGYVKSTSGRNAEVLTAEETEKIAQALKNNENDLNIIHYDGYPNCTLAMLEFYEKNPQRVVALRKDKSIGYDIMIKIMNLEE